MADDGGCYPGDCPGGVSVLPYLPAHGGSMRIANARRSAMEKRFPCSRPPVRRHAQGRCRRPCSGANQDQSGGNYVDLAHLDLLVMAIMITAHAAVPTLTRIGIVRMSGIVDLVSLVS